MKTFNRLALVAALGAITLTGCKLSDLTDSEDDGSKVVLQGRAAIGAPMAGATIDIKDANGNSYRVYADASGYFALEIEEEEFRPRLIVPTSELRAPVIVRATFNESEYHSVLCNVVYGEFDSVNVHPLTDYVMNETAAVATAYDMWTSGASSNYCNATFVEIFRDTASTLGTSFNFFNSAFEANGSGFDALLDSFNPETFERDSADAGFRVVNGLGSLALIPGTTWAASATGTFDGNPVNEQRTGEVEITADGLRELIAGVLENAAEDEIEIESLTITLEGDGVGEIGTQVTAILKGRAALAGLGFVARSFNVTVELERIAILEP